jgi:hypothetical protein
MELVDEYDRVLVAGDSFVKRLESHHMQRFGVKMSVAGRGVDFMGLPGKGVHDVDLSLNNLPWGLYSVIVLSVGSNDLCCASRTSVDVLHDLMSLSHKLIATGTGKVVICQLLHRASESHFQGLDLAEYNKRVDECNFWLEQNCCGLKNSSGNTTVACWAPTDWQKMVFIYMNKECEVSGGV